MTLLVRVSTKRIVAVPSNPVNSQSACSVAHRLFAALVVTEKAWANFATAPAPSWCPFVEPAIVYTWFTESKHPKETRKTEKEEIAEIAQSAVVLTKHNRPEQASQSSLSSSAGQSGLSEVFDLVRIPSKGHAAEHAHQADTEYSQSDNKKKKKKKKKQEYWYTMQVERSMWGEQLMQQGGEKTDRKTNTENKQRENHEHQRQLKTVNSKPLQHKAILQHRLSILTRCTCNAHCTNLLRKSLQYGEKNDDQTEGESKQQQSEM